VATYGAESWILIKDNAIRLAILKEILNRTFGEIV